MQSFSTVFTEEIFHGVIVLNHNSVEKIDLPQSKVKRKIKSL